MKKLLLVMGYGLLIMGFMGCATLKQITQPKALDTTPAALLSPYSGPKARIFVGDFEVKAAKANAEIGLDLHNMLVTALINSNCFSVVERQVLNTPMQEQKLSASGVSPAGSGPKKGKIKTAGLIIAVAVAEFEPRASGGVAGVGGGGGVGSGILGGLLGATLNKAHMALDIRIINASTSEALNATRVQGQASDVSGAIMGGFLGSRSLGKGLSVYAHTPMEKAIRICIIGAVRYISQTIPSSYYKY